MVIAIIKKRDVHNEANLTCCFIQFEKLLNNFFAKYQLKVKVRSTNFQLQILKFKTDEQVVFYISLYRETLLSVIIFEGINFKKGSNCSSDAF